MAEQSGGIRDPASHPVPQPWPWHTQRARGAGAEIAGHEVNADASVLAGLGGAFVHIILTVVTGITSWTLRAGETGTHSTQRDTDTPHEDMVNPSLKRYRQLSNPRKHAQHAETHTPPDMEGCRIHPAQRDTHTHNKCTGQTHRRNTQMHPGHKQPETHIRT